MSTLTVTNSNGASAALSEKGQFVLSGINGLGDVDADLHLQSFPYQDGAGFVDSHLQPRHLEVDFFIRGEGDTDISQKRSQLGKVFNPKAGLLKIQYQYGDIIREIEGVADHVPKYPSGQGSRSYDTQLGLINLTCPDPYWKSPIQTTRTLKAFTSLFRLPVRLPARMGTTGDSTSLLNLGDVEAPVIITVMGPVTNPQIKNETTGETIRINATLSSEESLRIDTDPRHKRVEILRNGIFVRNGFGLIDRNPALSTLWKLAAGENRVSYLADKGSDSATVTVQWNDRFVAV